MKISWNQVRLFNLFTWALSSLFIAIFRL